MVRRVRSCAVISRMPFHIELFWAGKESDLNLSTVLAAVASNLWISCGLLPWASTDACRSSRRVRRSCPTHLELSLYPENFLRGACTLVTHRPIQIYSLNSDSGWRKSRAGGKGILDHRLNKQKSIFIIRALSCLSTTIRRLIHSRYTPILSMPNKGKSSAKYRKGARKALSKHAIARQGV
jgi:hypothetical protein